MIRLHKSINLALKSLLVLEVGKLFEIGIVFAIKEENDFFFVVIGIIGLLFFALSKQVIGLLLVLVCNFSLIFTSNLENQHFGFLTCLLAILFFRELFFRLRVRVDEIDKVTALLLVLQLSTLYLFAGLWKINSDYFTGMQMLEHLRPALIFPNIHEPSFHYLFLLSVSGLLIELVLSTQILFRSVSLENIQTLGFLFHFSLIVFIGEDIRNSLQIAIFSLAALSIYPICDRSNWLDKQIIVFWDSECSFCEKSVTLFKKIDMTDNFEFLSNHKVVDYTGLPFPADLINETIIVWDTSSNKYWVKSRAVLYIITNNFFFWPLRPILRLSFLFKITDKLYDRVALNRSCHLKTS